MSAEAVSEANVEVNQEVNVQPESKPIVTICSHIKDDGIRCGTPALHGRHFCYFHERAHYPRGRISTRRYRAPIPDTFASLQIAMAHALQALMSGDLTPQEANSMMYGINLSTNLLRLSKPLTDAEKEQVATEFNEPMREVLFWHPDSQSRVSEPLTPAVPPVPAEAIVAAQNQIKELRSRILTPEYYEYFSEIVQTQKGIDDQKYQVAVNRVYEHDDAVKELRKLGVAV